MKRIGLFGGTFNPIHIGHIKMAEAARKEYKLDIVYFIPCGIPPHKSKKDLLPTKVRLELVKKAVRRKKYFKVLDIEIKKCKGLLQQAPNYTIDTILSVRGMLVTNKNLPNFYFLIGQDEFENLHTWHKAKELVKLVTFLVLPRKIKKNKKKKVRSQILGLRSKLVHTRTIDISSTEVRKGTVN